MFKEFVWCGFIFGIIITVIVHGAPTEDALNEAQAAQMTDLAINLENWMSMLPDDLRKVSIRYLAIPGSHDSFTSDITSKSDVSPDGEVLLKKLQFLKLVKTVMANWSKTQTFNVVKQLQAGIRFFDLRFCRNSDDTKLYFCHGMYSTEVRSVLTDMASYLNQHPKEVVILDCQHFYNFTSATHAEVIHLLKGTFGETLIPYQSSMDSLTLENLATLKQQVLVVYRDSSQSGQDLLWPTQSFPTPWYNTMNSNKLIKSLNNGLKSRSYSVGYVSQLVLTPTIDDILLNAFSTLRKKCAKDFQDKRTKWIANQTPGKTVGVNVIIVDFVDLEDDTFSKTVINLNRKLDIAQLNTVGIFEKIKTFFDDIKYYVYLV